MTEPRPRARRLLALLVTAGALDGCASWRGPSHEARRAEEAVERAEVVPSAPLPLPAPAPKPVRRVAKQWPPESIPGSQAQLAAELVATSAGAGTTPRDVARAIEVQFPAGGFVLDAAARRRLDGFAARLNLDDALYSLELQGHADASGTESANLALALKRTEVVRSYLLAATRIPSERIAVVSLGSGHPVADNSTPEGRAANRRVLVIALR